jgi:glycosyltransferase involved in cell wall biosynthesis
MKILYLVNHFKSHGGIERMLSLKIDAWIEEYGCEVTVVTLNQANAPVVYPPNNHFKLIDLNIQGVNNHSITNVLKFACRVQRTIKTEAPDAVVTTLTGISSLLLPFLAHKTRKILEIHSSGALSVTNSWKYKWWFLKKYYRIVLLNEDEKQYYRLNNLAVIPNFIKQNDEAPPSFHNREKVIIAAGRIHPEKQFNHIIASWEKIFRRNHDWRVEIYGDGDNRLLDSYRKYIAEHHIERIDFKPATNVLKAVMQRASLFLLSSSAESFGLVLLECKQNMLPAVSYDCPNGPRHIISDDGVLVKCNDIEAFAQEIDAFINDNARLTEMAENAYRNRHRFSQAEVMKQWNKLVNF